MVQVNFSNKENGDYLTANDVNELKSGININESVIIKDSFSGYFDENNNFRYNMHLEPKYDGRYDIGSSENKIRHIYVSNGSLWIGDDIKIDSYKNQLQVKTRDKTKLPSFITEVLGGTISGFTGFANTNNILETSLSQVEKYAQTLDPDIELTDIFPQEGELYYKKDDYLKVNVLNSNENSYLQLSSEDQSGVYKIPTQETNHINIDLAEISDPKLTLDLFNKDGEQKTLEVEMIFNNTQNLTGLLDITYEINSQSEKIKNYESKLYPSSIIAQNKSSEVKVKVLIIPSSGELINRAYSKYEYFNEDTYFEKSLTNTSEFVSLRDLNYELSGIDGDIASLHDQDIYNLSGIDGDISSLHDQDKI